MPRLHSPLNAIDPQMGWINAPVHVHDLGGSPVLLHFWSIHCEPCVEQWPRLKPMLDCYQARGLKVVGVHVPLQEDDLDTQVVEEHVQALGLHYPVAVDDASNSRSITLAHDVHAVPAFLLYDRGGVLRHYSAGPQALVTLEAALQRAVTEVEEQMAAP